MVTDEERREVAKRLRIERRLMDDEMPPKDPLACSFAYLSRLGKVVFTEGKPDMFNRLADLIDRPMTRNLSEKPEFVCELCGAVWPYDLGFTHCPECGAEVVE